MKIKSISCTQFAGIRDASLSFEDGVNVICGKNESGKSTIVNLISRTLFQNAKIDGRTDKSFCELYFPSARKGSAAVGDFADGKIVLETESGTCSLTKEWGSEPRCMLSTPDGIIKDKKTIDSLLRDILVYGEGVYTDMLLASQKNSDEALQTLLDSSRKTDAKQEITDSVTMAYAESDGVSIDSIEAAIDRKIAEIEGSHWDFENEIPQRKAGRWATGLGGILKAYYALEDASAVLDEISHLEDEADRAAAEYTEAETAVSKAEAELDSFTIFAGRLAVQKERREKIKSLEAQIAKYTTVLAEWPQMSGALEAAYKLQSEKNDCNILAKYNAAKALADEAAQLEDRIKNTAAPTADEIKAAKAAVRSITALENKLCGMNIAAGINMLGAHSIEVRTLRTGESVDISDGIASITEAVIITIPDVMELQLSPADVDTASISQELDEQKKILAEIYSKYMADNTDALDEMAAELAATKAKHSDITSRLAILLGGTDFDTLASLADGITTAPRDTAQIEADIKSLAGSADIARFIAEKETLIKKNEEDYGSADMLRQTVTDAENALDEARKSALGDDDIPEEYLKITNPEAYLADLKKSAEEKRAAHATALSDKTAAASRLEAYRENLTADPEEDFYRATRHFAEQKELLCHWKHIKEVFDKQKQALSDNPMQDIADRFCHYLDVISGGRVSSEFPERDKLSMSIYSDNRLLDYGKLSEGTKETVYLAFRLAVLDHLFPDGGGVVVLDDPFTDMDAERTAQGCALVKGFAARHQVIFLTCHDEYTTLLGGNTIRM